LQSTGLEESSPDEKGQEGGAGCFGGGGRERAQEWIMGSSNFQMTKI